MQISQSSNKNRQVGRCRSRQEFSTGPQGNGLWCKGERSRTGGGTEERPLGLAAVPAQGAWRGRGVLQLLGQMDRHPQLWKPIGSETGRCWSSSGHRSYRRCVPLPPQADPAWSSGMGPPWVLEVVGGELTSPSRGAPPSSAAFASANLDFAVCLWGTSQAQSGNSRAPGPSSPRAALCFPPVQGDTAPSVPAVPPAAGAGSPS